MGEKYVDKEWDQPQGGYNMTSGQVEVSDRKVEKILLKNVSAQRKEWTMNLDDALWEYRKAYKTPIGTPPYKMVIVKGFHLPEELEHLTYWSIKNLNLDPELPTRDKLGSCTNLSSLGFMLMKMLSYTRKRLSDGMPSISSLTPSIQVNMYYCSILY